MLIKCPECGKEISDTINACIHCGYVLKKSASIETVGSETSKENEQQITPIQNETFDSTDSDIVTDTNSISNNQKPKKKWIPIAIVSFVLIAIVTIVAIIISANSLNSNEKYVYEVATRYQNMLKDPDSLIIRGDILFVVDSEHERYVAFSASGSNSYGASVKSMPIYNGYSYLGDYEDDIDLGDINFNDERQVEEQMNLAKGKVIVASWNLYGYEMVGDDYLEVELISGKKIAKMLHCEWRE